MERASVMGGAELDRNTTEPVAGLARFSGQRRGGMVIAAQSHCTRISATGRAGAMMRRPDPIDRTGRENDLLTDAQVAARWQLSRGTLANQRSQGRGPAYLKLAGRVRYRRSDIEAYEQAGFVSREPAATTPLDGPTDVRETVERLIQSLGS